MTSNAYQNEDENGIGQLGTNARLSSCVSLQNPLLKTNRGTKNFYPSQGIIYPARNVWDVSNDTQSRFMMEEAAQEYAFGTFATTDYMNQNLYNNSYEQSTGPKLTTNFQLLPM